VDLLAAVAAEPQHGASGCAGSLIERAALLEFKLCRKHVRECELPWSFTMRARLLSIAVSLLVIACAAADSPPVLPGSVNAPPPEIAPAADAGDPLLTTGLWLWQGTQRGSDAKIVPDAPERYTLEFQAGGRVVVRADCNRGSGSYQLNGRSLTFGPLALTRAMCAPGSRDVEFLRSLAAVNAHANNGRELVLTFADNAGSMRFRVTDR
jgi:heat shock protein HslJ